jgi:hypothetical protein
MLWKTKLASRFTTTWLWRAEWRFKKAWLLWEVVRKLVFTEQAMERSMGVLAEMGLGWGTIVKQDMTPALEQEQLQESEVRPGSMIPLRLTARMITPVLRMWMMPKVRMQAGSYDQETQTPRKLNTEARRDIRPLAEPQKAHMAISTHRPLLLYLIALMREVCMDPMFLKPRNRKHPIRVYITLRKVDLEVPLPKIISMVVIMSEMKQEVATGQPS